MNRQTLVAVLAVVVVAGGIAFLALRRGGGDGGAQTAAAERVFVDDSLGVRLRLPDSPGWSLARDPTPRPDGRVVSAKHEDESAIVRVYALPAAPDAGLDQVFEGRKRQFAALFGVDDLDSIIAKVFYDRKVDINGRAFHQWQAISQPSAGTGEKPSAMVFMWVMTVDRGRSFECIGVVRTPPQPTPEEQTAVDARLRDVAYLMQSFEVR